MAIGTWNINGGLKPFDMDELNINEWLVDGPTTAKKTGMGYLDPSMHNNENNSDEIDIFARKFKYYLMDGVPVHRVLMNKTGLTEEKVLRLTIKDPESLFSSSLELTR